MREFLIKIVDWLTIYRPPAGQKPIGQSVLWTHNEKFNVEEYGTKYDVFIGPVSRTDAARIRELNPEAKIYHYILARDFQPWAVSGWLRFCDEHGVPPEAGYLHDEVGNRISSPDAGWPLANMTSFDYRTWAATEMLGDRYDYIDGMMIDLPLLFSEWSAIPKPFECTEEEFHDACEQWVYELKNALSGRPVFPNFTTVWWMEHSFHAKRMQRIVQRTKAVYLQGGGTWTLGWAKDALVIEGNMPSTVHIETGDLG